MTDILDLDGWNVLSRTQEEQVDILEAEYLPQPLACPKCGTLGHFYRHGTKTTTYVDVPFRGKPAKLQAKVQRYRCRSEGCGETFLQPLGGILEDRRIAKRAAEYIQGTCLRDTFVRIAEDVGCDEKTVRALASEHIARLEGSYRPELPEWLGMDETMIAKELRCVLTDVKGRRVIDMLPARDKGTVAAWLRQFPDLRGVQGLAIDMWRPYKDVAQQMMPGLPVVVDKFHVVRMASYCMERVRIRLQKKRVAGVRKLWLQSKAILNMRHAKLGDKARLNLDIWLSNEPELAAAYALKEAFYDIYDLPKPQAIAAFDAYSATVPDYLRADFKVLLTAMKNWRTEILAFFDYPITNAYTEAVNGVAKTINRQGRGYSFEVLRARLLFGKRLKAVEPWHLAAAFPANPAHLRLLTKEQEGRCQTCGEEIGRAVDDRPHVASLARGKERKQVLICGGCFKAFHTKALSHKKPPSTHQSE